jgi:hypothetical protein
MTGKVANFANYPNGFAGGLMLKDHPVVQNDTGKVFWVAEGANGTVAAFPNTKSPSDGNKGTFRVLTTLLASVWQTAETPFMLSLVTPRTSVVLLELTSTSTASP